jgi:hypothetical protein
MTKATASPTSASGSNNLLTSSYYLPLAMLIGANSGCRVRITSR